MQLFADLIWNHQHNSQNNKERYKQTFSRLYSACTSVQYKTDLGFAASTTNENFYYYLKLLYG